MKGRILTEDLRRVAYNTRIYSMKSASIEGGSLWIQGALTIRVVSSDDYIILTDTAQVVGAGGASYEVMSYDQLEGLSKALEAHEDDYFDLGDVSIESDSPHMGTLAEADQIVFEVDHYGTVGGPTFAVAPQRLAKFRLVKPGGFPIDIRSFEEAVCDGLINRILGYRIGPTVRGVIAPLDREKLKGKYTGEELWGS